MLYILLPNYIYLPIKLFVIEYKYLADDGINDHVLKALTNAIKKANFEFIEDIMVRYPIMRNQQNKISGSNTDHGKMIYNTLLLSNSVVEVSEGYGPSAIPIDIIENARAHYVS